MESLWDFVTEYYTALLIFCVWLRYHRTIAKSKLLDRFREEVLGNFCGLLNNQNVRRTSSLYQKIINSLYWEQWNIQWELHLETGISIDWTDHSYNVPDIVFIMILDFWSNCFQSFCYYDVLYFLQLVLVFMYGASHPRCLTKEKMRRLYLTMLWA